MYLMNLGTILFVAFFLVGLWVFIIDLSFARSCLVVGNWWGNHWVIEIRILFYRKDIL